MDLDGRVALVTGASSGIGARIAERLAHAGARVALSYGKGREPAEALRDELPGAIALQADMRDPDAPAALVDAVEAQLGPVDILVANAGAGETRALEDVDLATWDETIAVNLRAPFLLAQRTVPAMRERGWGRILFTSSVAAFTGGIVGPHYAASKSGLHGLLHFIASREAAHGITANALAPALIGDTAMLPGDPEELARKIPAGRLGTPQEVADLALAVIRNGYLSNQVIGIDGAMYPR